jgi:malonyl-CoA decarboxylase
MSEVKGSGVTQAVGASLFARIKGLAAKRWRDIAHSNKAGATVVLAPDLPEGDLGPLRAQMRACLAGQGGDVSARARAAAMGREYLALAPAGRLRFLRLLAEEFGPDRAVVDAAIAKVQAASPEGRAAAERGLWAALESPRLKLLTQFNALPEGVKFLVDLRAELVPLARGDAALSALEADLKGLLTSWFDVGFLELHRVTWRSPAVILEKIMEYEAVHAIQGWDDIKNRLDNDRRLYGFFHPRMPDEPLIFVEVALVKGISGNIHELLDETAPLGDPEVADTAIFYSINNAQKGLNGISFGNFLIKKVVDRLSHEFPKLRTFSTLSPIPGFRPWLEERLSSGEPGLLTTSEHRVLSQLSAGMGAKGSLKALLAEPDWTVRPQVGEALKVPMTRLAARYLTQEKRNDGRALDAVAHFHLSNGARVERLNWMADLSAKGLAQAAGMMVNYLYKLDEIGTNHESYSASGKVAMSSEIKALQKG